VLYLHIFLAVIQHIFSIKCRNFIIFIQLVLKMVTANFNVFFVFMSFMQSPVIKNILHNLVTSYAKINSCFVSPVSKNKHK